MLGKLYKHEFVGLYRIMLPLYGFLLCLAGALRLLLIIDSKAIVFDIILRITVTLTVILAVGLMFAGFVLIVVNFYKSLLSKQGYLTFSLPFKARTHLVCKLVCSVISMITSIIVEFAALLIIFCDFNFIENIFNVLKTMWETGNDAFGLTKLIILIVEILIVCVTTLSTSILMFFAAMSVGQQFKNKILGAVVSYFAIYAVVEVILLVFAGTFSKGMENLFVYKNVSEMFFTFQNVMIFVFLVSALEAVGYFCLANFFLSKKLNLE